MYSNSAYLGDVGNADPVAVEWGTIANNIGGYISNAGDGILRIFQKDGTILLNRPAELQFYTPQMVVDAMVAAGVTPAQIAPGGSQALPDWMKQLPVPVGITAPQFVTPIPPAPPDTMNVPEDIAAAQPATALIPANPLVAANTVTMAAPARPRWLLWAGLAAVALLLAGRRS